MTNADQPPTTEERLSRLETLFANVGEKVVEHDATIDVLVANIQQLTENVNAVNQRVDALTINVNTVAARVDALAEQAAQDRQAFRERTDRIAAEAAQDRQQAAIDRQEFRTEIRQIWEYLRNRNGGSSPP